MLSFTQYLREKVSEYDQEIPQSQIVSEYDQEIPKSQIVSEYDQEIPQSPTTDNPVAPRGRAALPSRDTRKTN